MSPLFYYKMQTQQTPAKFYHPTDSQLTSLQKKWNSLRTRYLNAKEVFLPLPCSTPAQSRLFCLLGCWLLNITLCQSLIKAMNSIYSLMDYTELDKDCQNLTGSTMKSIVKLQPEKSSKALDNQTKHTRLNNTNYPTHSHC